VNTARNNSLGQVTGSPNNIHDIMLDGASGGLSNGRLFVVEGQRVYWPLVMR
jgi:hypothetical protein